MNIGANIILFLPKIKGACDKFYYCVDGMFNMIQCPQGLVFNYKTGTNGFGTKNPKQNIRIENRFNLLHFGLYQQVFVRGQMKRKRKAAYLKV